MTIDAYNHMVEIDESSRKLTIYRLLNGKKILYTQTEIPNVVWDDAKNEMNEFCRLLGENILFDSPQARRILKS
jgi:hypothetical protein